MKTQLLDLIDFERINTLLDGFNKTTGFVTAILDLEGNVLSQSGWRSICTEFHRVNFETAKKCTTSDTELAGKMASGEKYHFYKCLNGLVDVAVPLIIDGEHIANLFTGQFFFEEPDRDKFLKQAEKYGFKTEEYMKSLSEVPVFSEEHVKPAMDFLLNVTNMIAEMSMQQLKQAQSNRALKESEEKYRLLHEAAGVGIGYYTAEGIVISYNNLAAQNMNGNQEDFVGKSIYEVFSKETADFYLGRIKRAALSEISVEFEDEVDLPTGKKWFTSVFTRIIDSTNTLLGIQIISTDITERKQALELLSEQTNMLSESQQMAHIGSFRWEFKTGQLNWSDETFRLFGIEKSSGTPNAEALLKAVYPEDQIRHQNWMRACMAGENVAPFDYRVVLPDGSIIWHLISGGIEYDVDGLPVALVGTNQDISERKKSEELIKTHEREIRLLIDSTNDVIFSIDTQYRLMTFNKKYHEGTLMGSGMEPIVGESVFFVEYPPELLNLWKEKYDAVFKGESLIFESETSWKDNTKIFYSNSLQPMKDASDNIIGLVCFTRDITEQKEAEEALKQSEERFKMLFEKAPLGYQSLDEDGNFIEVNETWLETLGYSKNEVVGKWFGDFLSPNYTEGFRKRFPIFKAQGIIHSEFEMIRKDGSKIFIAFEGRIGYNHIGEFKQTHCVLSDITEIRRVGMALAASEKEFRLLAESMPQIVWIADANGSNIYFNQQWVEYTGMSLEESYGAGWNKPFHPDDQNRALDAWQNAVNNNGVYSIEVRLKRFDSEYFWWLVRGIPVLDENGEILKWFGTCTDIHEFKQVQENQLDLLNRIRRISANVPGAIYEYCLRPDGTSYVPYASEGFKTLYEFSPEDVKTDASLIYNLIHTDDRERYFKSVTESAEKLTLWHDEHRIVLPSNKIKWVEGKATPHKLDDGTIIWHGYLTDITERKNTEVILNKTLKQNEIVLLNALDGFWITDIKGHFLEVNDASCKLLGYTREEMLSLQVVDVEYLENQDDVLERIDRMIKNGSERFETKHRSKNGEIFDIEININYWEQEQKFFIFLQDITERKKAEIELRTSQEKFKAVADVSPLAIYASSGPEQIAQYINPEFHKMFGYTWEDVPTVGEWWKKGFPDANYRQKVITEWQHEIDFAVANNTDVKPYECVCACKDGSEKIIAWSAKTIGDEFWAFGADLTERIQAEEVIKNLNQSLEQKIEERTVQLTNANKELESFSYSISHDLRAPLRAILGFSQILSTRHVNDLNDEGKKYMGYIVESASRMEQLINDLLNYSRLGRKEIQKTELSLLKIIDTVRSDYSAQFEETKGKMIVNSEIETIFADETLLQQIFSNLIGNALKYKQKDVIPEISIDCVKTNKAITITVSDNGIGIPEEYWEKVFNVFQRLHTEADYPGTGIGLATVKKAVNMLDGNIQIQSKTNEGTSFIITLFNQNKSLK